MAQRKTSVERLVDRLRADGQEIAEDYTFHTNRRPTRDAGEFSWSLMWRREGGSTGEVASQHPVGELLKEKHWEYRMSNLGEFLVEPRLTTD